MRYSSRDLWKWASNFCFCKTEIIENSNQIYLKQYYLRRILFKNIYPSIIALPRSKYYHILETNRLESVKLYNQIWSQFTELISFIYVNTFQLTIHSGPLFFLPRSFVFLLYYIILFTTWTNFTLRLTAINYWKNIGRICFTSFQCGSSRT